MYILNCNNISNTYVYEIHKQNVYFAKMIEL